MGTTPNLGLRYPAGTDAPNGALQIQNLANDVDGTFAYQSYTPTLRSDGTSPTGWNTFGFYVKINKIVIFEASFVAQSGFTNGSGNYFFGLPAAPATTSILSVGNAVITNNNYIMVAVNTSDSGASECCLYRPDNSGLRVGAGGPYLNAWATGNTVRISGTFRST